ncbi:molybdopterin biosynthesis protein MoeD [Candidatus Pelagibacter sp.]|jgi:molybdopterin converting factor small subunit|nr:molybdopterin biosynthesis protein MoeD [Candidatus Pelagibacter sp.]
MNIKIELFGAARDFSKQNILELNIENNSSLKDIRAKMIEYIKKNFGNNENYIRIINSSAFSSKENIIISDNYKITNNEKIAIIPPIGGG